MEPSSPGLVQAFFQQRNKTDFPSSSDEHYGSHEVVDAKENYLLDVIMPGPWDQTQLVHLTELS